MKDWPGREFNVEGNPTQNLMKIAHDLSARGLPLHQVTFVPDSEDQFTSDHGWSFPADAERLKPLIKEVQSRGVRVSLFMDPDASAMAAARAVGADRVEFYTESYARAWGTPEQAKVLALFAEAGKAAAAAGLDVNAGHDLNRDNLTDFFARCAAGDRSLHRPCADCRCAGAGLRGDSERLFTLHRCCICTGDQVIFGIGTDICDIRRIRASFGSPRRALCQKKS